MSAHTYSSDFYDYIDAGSSLSAQVVSRLMIEALRVESLLDVGGGHEFQPIGQTRLAALA